MKPATRAWVNKAEGDGETARRETRVRKRPNYDAACFHAQQAAEKYLKAVLTEEGRPFPKIHDLVKLSEGCIDRMAHLRLYEADLDVLSRYAIAFRYPGESATKRDAQVALLAMRHVRALIREHLGLRP